MLTSEQEAKARIALGLSESLADRLEREIAFDNHLKALEWIKKYNLPYRISLDYLKSYSLLNGFVCINPCYPYPGYLKANLIHLKPDQISLHDPNEKPGPKGYSLNLTPIDKDMRKKIEEHNRTFAPWDLSTQEGFKKWEYYFAHLFNKADFDKYKCFDWFGVRTLQGADREGHQEQINYWKSLQASYHIAPDKYMQEEPLLSDYNLDDYIDLAFIPEWEEGAENGKQDNTSMLCM